MKRKKSIAARLGIAAFALTLVTTCMTGGTLAKYVSEVEGTGTSIAAKWVFKAGATDGAETYTATFKLGDTTKSTVVAADKIAPGTTGEIPIFYDLTGTEVSAQVKVEIKVDDKDKLPTNFKIKKGDGTYITPADMTNDTYIEVSTTAIALADMASKGKGNAHVTWEWPFETGADAAAKKTGNTADTTIGKTPDTATFTIKVTGEQLATNPTPAP